MAEIHPCARTHALIYTELARAGCGVHRVARVGSGFRQCRIAHVYGIISGLGNVGAPCGARGSVGPAHGRGPACRACTERIVAVAQRGFGIGKTGHSGIVPDRSVVGIPGNCASAVGVDDYFNGVRVAFARTHHIGPRILQHGHKERHHVALRVQILHSLEYACALPLPSVQLRLEIPSVALPQGYIGSVKPFRGWLSLHIGHKNAFLARCARSLRCKACKLVEAAPGRAYIYLCRRYAQRFSHFCLKARHALLRKRNVGHGIVAEHGHALAACVCIDTVHTYATEAGGAGTI